jgi:hypothetical protein
MMENGFKFALPHSRASSLENADSRFLSMQEIAHRKPRGRKALMDMALEDL